MGEKMRHLLRSRRFQVAMWLLVVAIVTTRLWFIEDFTITNVDLDYPVDPVRNWLDRMSTWYQTRGGGVSAGSTVLGAGMYALPAFFHVIGGYSFGQYLTFMTINLTMMLSIIYFLSSYTNIYRSWSRATASVFAAVSATYAFYLAFTWVRLQTANYILIFALLVFGITTRFVMRRCSPQRFLIGIALISITTSWSLGSQPPLLTIFFGLYVAYVILLVVAAKRWAVSSPTRNVFGIIGGAVGIAVTSLWWFIPWLSFLRSQKLFDPEVLNSTYAVRELLATGTLDMSISNSMRNIGDFAWFGGYWPQIDPWLTAALLIFSSFLLSIVGGLGLVRSAANIDRTSTFTGFWFFVAMVGVLFSTGIFGLVGAFYEWALIHVPLFNLQRAPWQKFMALPWIGLILPVYWGFLRIFQRLTEERQVSTQAQRGVAVLIGLAVVLPSSWLILTGQMFSKGWGDEGWHETNGFGFHLRFPDYIFTASETINEDFRDSDVLLLPESSVQAYDWGYGSSHDITWLTLKTGVIAPNYGEGLLPPNAKAAQDRQKTAIDAMYSSPETAACLLAEAGIGTFLFRGDFRNEYLASNQYSEGMSAEEKGEIPRTFWSDLANSLPGISYLEQNGPWLTYVSDPEIYEASRKLRIVPLSFDDTAICPIAPDKALVKRSDVMQSPTGNVFVAEIPAHEFNAEAILNENEPDRWGALILGSERDSWPFWLDPQRRLAGLLYPAIDLAQRAGQTWVLSMLAPQMRVDNTAELKPGRWLVPESAESKKLVIFHKGEGALTLSLLSTFVLTCGYCLAVFVLACRRRVNRAQARRREGAFDSVPEQSN